MAENSNVQNRTQKQVDVVGLIRDVARQWQSILMVAIAAALLAISVGQARYTPTYTTKAVLYVTGSGNSTVYQDLYSSTQVAPKFTEILNSFLVVICEDNECYCITN